MATMNYGSFISAPRRARSREVDFGVWWWHVENPGGPPWRVSWIEATGELYAVPMALSDDRPVLVLGVYPTREEIERALAGWADRPTTVGPLVNIHARNKMRR